MMPMGCRVLFVGNFSHTWCSEVHWARTYQALGCTVHCVQENKTTPEAIEETALSFGADLVHYTRTWGLPPTVTDVWRRLEARGVKTVSYHLDLYFGLARETGLVADESANGFWRTQYVFSADGDPESHRRFEALGINHYWLPPAVVHDECVPGSIRAEFSQDVVFVGSEHYHQEWPWRRDIISTMRNTYGRRFGRYGNGSRVVRDFALNDLYASAKCAVGDSLCPGYRKPNYVSDRLFEAGGRGAVQVFPRVPGVEETFGLVDEEHLLFYQFGDVDGLRDRVEWCLDNPDAARAMAARGQAFIKARHTYVDRFAHAMHIMGLRDSPLRPPDLVQEARKPGLTIGIPN